MEFLRLEVYEKDQLVFVREKPVFAKTEKARRATHTRLVNWAIREFPESTSQSVEVIQHPRGTLRYE
jgi:hypothetical protein